MARVKSISAAIDLIREKLPDIANNIAEEVKTKSIQNSPVDTGELKNSYNIIPATQSNNLAIVRNNADHAVYVEFGDINNSGRRMMTQAANSIPRNGNKYVR